jgi:hypothetical protein
MAMWQRGDSFLPLFIGARGGRVAIAYRALPCRAVPIGGPCEGDGVTARRRAGRPCGEGRQRARVEKKRQGCGRASPAPARPACGTRRRAMPPPCFLPALGLALAPRDETSSTVTAVLFQNRINQQNYACPANYSEITPFTQLPAYNQEGKYLSPVG